MILCGREFGPELIARLHQSGSDRSRRALSRQLCQWLDWKGPSGTWQTTNARIALKRLERLGLIQPAARANPLAGPRKAPPPAAPAWPPVRGSLAQMGPVELVLVGRRDRRAFRQARQLLEAFHPRGARLCGSQLRYLIRCPHGLLGGHLFQRGGAPGASARAVDRLE